MSPILGIFAITNPLQYKVGDTGPGGGKIFYASIAPFTGGSLATPCNYLESAPISGTNSWTDSGYVWSGNTNTLIGATAQGTAIGTGYANTIAMVTQNNTASRAGTISRAYRGPNNLSDWYLPSKDELNQFRIQRAVVGGTSGNAYWSSSEISAQQCWANDFNRSVDFEISYAKQNSGFVRPIRAF